MSKTEAPAPKEDGTAGPACGSGLVFLLSEQQAGLLGGGGVMPAHPRVHGFPRPLMWDQRGEAGSRQAPPLLYLVKSEPVSLVGHPLFFEGRRGLRSLGSPDPISQVPSNPSSRPPES